MELKDRISIAVSGRTGIAQHELEPLASTIAEWCAEAAAGETRKFELSGWLLMVRKESELTIILAPATTVAGAAIVTPSTQHQRVIVTLG